MSKYVVGQVLVALTDRLYRGMIVRVIRTLEDGVEAVSRRAPDDGDSRCYEDEVLTDDLLGAIETLEEDRKALTGALIAIRGSNLWDEDTKSWYRSEPVSLKEAQAIAHKALTSPQPIGLRSPRR